MDSRRRLPHVYPENRWLFVTWHLYGSLPRPQYPPPHVTSAGKAFLWVDRRLDLTRSGPLFLRQEKIAALVVESLFRGVTLGHHRLGSFVVMPNHVHVLLLPLIPPGKSLKSLKGATAREANLLLGRTGEPFWQRESYDRWVRSDEEFSRIALYIEGNPVKAGLVSRAEDYAWSSANPNWSSRLRDPCVHTSVNAACAPPHATPRYSIQPPPSTRSPE